MTEHHIPLSDMRAAIKAVHDGGHSVFSPSGSKMWMSCAGSLIPNLFARDDAGIDAAYGTVGHAVGEQWLKTGKKPRELIGITRFVESGDWGHFITIDEDMLDHVQRYVDWVRHLPGYHFVEQKVYFSQLTPIPNQGGTADHVVCSPGHMTITDLKMGKGVWVFAEENSQAMLYALGFFYKWDWFYDFQEFEIRIAQPRLDHWDIWHITRERLLAFAEEVRVKAAAAWRRDALRSPSPEACQWCKVAASCAARAAMIFEIKQGIFKNIGKPMSHEKVQQFKDEIQFMGDNDYTANVNDLSTEQMEKLFGFRGTTEKWFAAVEAELASRAKQGMPMREVKLVESRANRKFRNEVKAAEGLIALGCKPADVKTESVCSPAVAEVLLRKAGVPKEDIPETLLSLGAYKPKGQPVLVPKTDKRPVLNDTYDVFSDTELDL
jgi:hypothetical protein